MAAENWPMVLQKIYDILPFCAVNQFRAHSHLATTTQIFDVVTMSSEMGCIVFNVTIHTWQQKKKHIVVTKCERALTLQLGFDSIGNSRIVWKEILNTTNNGAGSHFSFKKENFQK